MALVSDWDDGPGGYLVPRRLDQNILELHARKQRAKGNAGKLMVLGGGMEVTPIKSGRVWRQPSAPLYGDEGDTWIVVPESVLVAAVHYAFMQGDIDWLELEEDLEEVMWRGQEPKHASLQKHARVVAGRALPTMPNPTKPEGGVKWWKDNGGL